MSVELLRTTLGCMVWPTAFFSGEAKLSIVAEIEFNKDDGFASSDFGTGAVGVGGVICTKNWPSFVTRGSGVWMRR